MKTCVSVFWAVVLIFVGLAGASPPAGAAKPPQWLVDEAARPLPSLPPETEAVVLFDGQRTDVNPKGVITVACRRAIRVLRPGGVGSAQRLMLATGFDSKINSMTGWVINPSGAHLQVTMKQVISSSLAPDTLYMDTKLLLLAVPEVDVGSVVGFEWEEERTPPTIEDADMFQGEFPVLRAAYSLSMPPRWEAVLNWVHWPPVDPVRSPATPETLTLEIKDIPAIVEEPHRPNLQALAGRLLVGFKPFAGSVRSFSGWGDMGAWYAGLSATRRIPDPTVTTKAQELTAGAPDTLSKIRLLAEFAQKNIRYVSVQIGIGGFQPHPASSILANRYGDCKDKATLLAAMLKAVGVDSDYIVINTDRGIVTGSSPVSLYSFNHVILAIRLPADVPDEGLDALIRHPRLGRLLAFDPTMPTTPFGRLPFYLQDNYGLLVADGSGELIALPRAGPEGNLLDRKGQLVLTADGALSGEMLETRRGFEADLLRYQIQAATDAERRKYLETFLSRSFASFSLQSYEFKNLDDVRADLVVAYRFVASAYAKRAGGYLVLRPRVVGQKAVDLGTKGQAARLYPIDLETTTLARDEFTIELPEGCGVDSPPKPVDLEAGFAAYRSRTEMSGRTLVYRREYRLNEPVIPVARYGEALKFFLAVGSEEQQSLLLKTGGSRRP